MRKWAETISFARMNVRTFAFACPFAAAFAFVLPPAVPVPTALAA